MTGSRTDGQILLIVAPSAARRAFTTLIFCERLTVLKIVLLYLTGSAVAAMIPIALGGMIDGLVTEWSREGIDFICAALLLGVVLQLFVTRSAYRMSHRYGERVSANLRENSIGRVLRMPLPIIERVGIADILTRTAGDVSAVSRVLREIGPGVVAAGIELIVLTVAVMCLSPLLALLLIPVIPVLIVVARRYVRITTPLFAEERAVMAEVAGLISATNEGSRTVTVHEIGNRRARLGEGAITKLWGKIRQIIGAQTWFMPSLDVAHIIPVALILWIGGFWANEGYLSIGAVVAGAMLTYRVAGPIERIMYSVTDIQSATAALARIEGLASLSIRERYKYTQSSDIKIHDVTFGYGDGPDVLEVSELEIPPGTRTVVVGRSGSGKSTLARLIAGIEEPRTGQITIGGTNTAEIALDCLRNRVILMSQESHIFQASLRDNLLLGAADATDAALWEALDNVGASWCRNLEEGLDTILETPSTRMDTARRQQLSIARVLVANADIIIFDESFAALDFHMKGELEARVLAMIPGKTVIVIAHQLSVVTNETHIVMMENGRVAEVGPHKVLSRGGGAYAELWKTWKPEAIGKLPNTGA